MSREILFRGKRIKTGKWGYGDLIRAKGKTFVGEEEENIFWMEAEVYPDTVGQYTGLCDKNGNKIFEGDLVFAGYGEYYQGQHEHSATMIIDMADYEALNALCNANVVEVIGNLYVMLKEESK